MAELRQAQGPSEVTCVWARNLDWALQLEWKQVLSGVEGTGDSRRAAAADNDNSAWPERTFRFEAVTGRAAA